MGNVITVGQALGHRQDVLFVTVVLRGGKWEML